MPTSTSSFEQPAPSGLWARTWILAAILTLTAVGCAEAFWRCFGHLPSVTDSHDLWSAYRAQAYGRRTIVLAGASRIQLDVLPKVIHQRLPHYRAVQLAVQGRSALALLEDLATDAHFNGVLILDMVPSDADDWSEQQGYVRHYHLESTHNRRANALLGARVQEKLVVTNAHLNLHRVIVRVLSERVFTYPLYMRTHADRSRSADYTQADLPSLRESRIQSARRRYLSKPFDEVKWQVNAARIETAIDRICDRGGQVVVIRMPTTGPALEYALQAQPLERVWRPFAAKTRAAAIHFLDDPRLSAFKCPDTSHLDYRDAPAFTSALIDILIERGVLQE